MNFSFFIFIVIFFAYLYFRNKDKNNNFFASVILWAIIFVTLIIVYAFRFELTHFKNKILANLIPSYSWVNEQGEITIARHGNGHFYLETLINDKHQIRFLVDTGATGVALTKEDAIKLGFNLSKLNYTQKSITANGISYSAPVKLNRLTIGARTFKNISASVSSGGLSTSLLGMSVIDNFKHIKIINDLLILSH